MTGAEKEFKLALQCQGDIAPIQFNLAQLYVRAKKWDEATDLLNQALASHPDPSSLSYAIHFKLAEAAERLSKQNEAVVKYKLALKFNPHDEDSMNNLARIYDNTGQLKLAIDQMKSYLAVFPNGQSSARMRALPPSLEQMRKFEDADPITYLGSVTRQGKLRWSNSKPIRVFIKAPTTLSGYKPEYSKYMSDSFDDWTQSSGSLKWELAASADAADIVCNWVDKIPSHAGVNNNEGGYTVFETLPTSSGTISSAVIYLLVRPPDAHEQFSQAWYKAACLHEVGHSLGLNGHSAKSEDVMFFAESTDKPLEKLSAWDSSTIAKLYATD